MAAAEIEIGATSAAASPHQLLAGLGQDDERLSTVTESSRDWVAKVRQRPPALDLEPGLFTWNDPQRIARSLWQSARQSKRRRRSVYGSAMSMLCLYLNRAGRILDPNQRTILEAVKHELRRLAAAGPMA